MARISRPHPSNGRPLQRSGRAVDSPTSTNAGPDLHLGNNVPPVSPPNGRWGWMGRRAHFCLHVGYRAGVRHQQRRVEGPVVDGRISSRCGFLVCAVVRECPDIPTRRSCASRPSARSRLPHSRHRGDVCIHRRHPMATSSRSWIHDRCRPPVAREHVDGRRDLTAMTRSDVL